MIARSASRSPLRLCVSLRISTSATRQNIAPPQYVRPHVCVWSRPSSPGLRLALVHVAHHVVPHALRLQVAHHHPRQRLNVGGQSLFHPVLVVGQRGKRRVHQLVRHHPVVIQVGCVMCSPMRMRVNAGQPPMSPQVVPCITPLRSATGTISTRSRATGNRP